MAHITAKMAGLPSSWFADDWGVCAKQGTPTQAARRMAKTARNGNL
jgi:hypothetical protein